MNKLKNKKLKRIIRFIDGSKFKKKNLEKMMKDKDFADFVNEILMTLNFLKSNGEFSFSF